MARCPEPPPHGADLGGLHDRVVNVAVEVELQAAMVLQHFLGKEELEHGSKSTADHLASLICRIPEQLTGPRASPLDHSWITHSRHRTALGGHQRTPAWSISYSRGRLGSLSDTGGHASDTVRDREAPGSNPGPPTIFVFEIGDFSGRLESAEHSWITISCRAMKPGRCNRAFREAM